MTLLIGIDEAGYGPNLGPLCIRATAWHVEESTLAPSAKTDADLYQLLAEIIAPVPDGERIAIADSKLLYKPASHQKNRGLAQLERGVLPALAGLRENASDWRTLLAPPALPWYDGYDCPLPMDTSAEDIVALAERFSSVCEAASVRLVDLRVRMVFPREFNELCEHYGTKGAALSHVSIALLRDLSLAPSAKTKAADDVQVAAPDVGDSSWQTTPTEGTRITCDKHGGRNRYAALLQHHFSDEAIEILEESRPVSRYRWGQPAARTDIKFRTKGEAELPVALASMAAKYHRELAMRAFNAFWQAHLPGLRPTAGYPQDAKRFKNDIAAVQSELGIDDQNLWRNR